MKDCKDTNESEEEPGGLGNWMIDWDLEERVKARIACPQKGYPLSEALYASIEDWEKANNQDWFLDYLNF